MQGRGFSTTELPSGENGIWGGVARGGGRILAKHVLCRQRQAGAKGWDSRTIQRSLTLLWGDQLRHALEKSRGSWRWPGVGVMDRARQKAGGFVLIWVTGQKCPGKEKAV